MSEEERLDIVEGVDEEGNRLILRVNRYFFYNGEEYSYCQCGKGLNCTKSVFAWCALSTPCRGSAIGVVLPLS